MRQKMGKAIYLMMASLALLVAIGVCSDKIIWWPNMLIATIILWGIIIVLVTYTPAE